MNREDSMVQGSVYVSSVPVKPWRRRLRGMMTGGAVIREARLRAGMSQGDLAMKLNRDRTQIARWERDAVSPSFDAVMEIVALCGLDLHLDFRPALPVDDAVIQEWVNLSPSERIARALEERERRG